MLREFFSMYMAECIVSNRKQEAIVARDLWKKHVREGSEIYKEMVLSKTLLETKFANAPVAQRFMDRVSETAARIDGAKLEQEKTAFIREINSTVGTTVFDRTLNGYTALASVHVVLNEWINDNQSSKKSLGNLKNISKVEDNVLDFLCEESKPDSLDPTIFETSEKTVDGLVVSIMHEKLNKKYSKVLTDDQKKILQQSVFSNEKVELKETLERLRDETIGLINKELTSKKDMKKVDELSKIKALLEGDYNDVSKYDDTNVVFYMTVSKLNDDLKDKD